MAATQSGNTAVKLISSTAAETPVASLELSCWRTMNVNADVRAAHRRSARRIHAAADTNVQWATSDRGEHPVSWVRNPRLYMPTSVDEVWDALALGAVCSVGLLVGAIAGSISRRSHHAIAIAMSVGAGLLLAAVSLKVAADAIRIAGPVAAALSLLLGAAVFSASNALLAQFGAAHRKRCGDCIQQPTEKQQPGSGVAIALGNALDAVPEAMVLGIALRGPVVPLALVIAFSVVNLPMALSSTAGMRTAGRSYAYIFLLWSAIAIGAVVAGYVGFGLLSEAWPPRLQAFGAGALLAMAAETMIPEAFHDSPRFSGLLAALGFGLLLLVDATTR
jgi:ZIP family zinc transporter